MDRESLDAWGVGRWQQRSPERTTPWAYLPHALIARPSATTTGHWQGGPARHAGATCPSCERPLALLWDLDLGDTAVRGERARGFGDWARLPLYFCWRCAGILVYRVEGAGAIQVLYQSDGPQGDDFPYPDYPASYPRGAIALVAPTDVVRRALVALDAGEDAGVLSAADYAAVSALLEREIRPGRGAWRAQLGGALPLEQGHEHWTCPDPACGAVLQELAAIPNDPFGGLPMTEDPEALRAEHAAHLAECAAVGRKPFMVLGANHWVQVVYQICPDCRLLVALNRCD